MIGIFYFQSCLRDHPFKTSAFLRVGGVKICQICWQIVVKNCWREGGWGQKSWKFADVLNGWSLISLFLPVKLRKKVILIWDHCLNEDNAMYCYSAMLKHDFPYLFQSFVTDYAEKSSYKENLLGQLNPQPKKVHLIRRIGSC